MISISSQSTPSAQINSSRDYAARNRNPLTQSTTENRPAPDNTITASFDSLFKNEKTNIALSKYASLAEEYQNEKPVKVQKETVSYSSHNAINQYMMTKNADFIENTTKLLGLSVYA